MNLADKEDMGLANKPCYPQKIIVKEIINIEGDIRLNETSYDGLTFRERLIIAGMGNAGLVIKFIGNDDREYPDIEQTNLAILQQADAIIKEMEGEK